MQLLPVEIVVRCSAPRSLSAAVVASMARALALREARRARSDESMNRRDLAESASTDDGSARNAFPPRPSWANRCRQLLKRGQFVRSGSFVDLVLVRRRLTLRSTRDVTGM
jgi:hypothetical protein